MTVELALASTAYRARPELSYSESKLLQRAPAALKWHRDHPEDSTPTPAQAFGTMVHCATLEPAAFDARYVIAPLVDKRTKEWKEFLAFCQLDGRLPCTQDDRVAAFACAESVRTHPIVGPLLAAGHPEVSCFWADPATGVACKARLDWVHPLDARRVMLLDLKTAADATKAVFTRSVVTFQYHRQADWYERGYAIAAGCDVSPMLFVVVESQAPYLCVAYTLDRWFMAQAAKVNYALRALYKHCLEFDEWPGYDPEIVDLEAPRWALDEELRAEMREEEYAS